MKRHTLLLGDYPFLVDILDSNDLGYQIQKGYYILKNSFLTNDTLIDSDVLFIEKELADNDDYDSLVWPMAESSDIPFMSTKMSAFNKGITSSTELKTGLKKLYGNDLKEKKLNTLLVRVWHPQTLVNRDLLVYADSYINSVHFHWLAKKMHDGGTSTISEEVRVGQNTYIEHFDFLMPDFRDFLFNDTWTEDNIPISDLSTSNIKLHKILNKNTWTEVKPKTIEKSFNQQEYDLLTEDNKELCSKIINYHYAAKDISSKLIKDKWITQQEYDLLTDEEKQSNIIETSTKYKFVKKYYENPKQLTQLVNCRTFAMQWKYGKNNTKVYVDDEARTLQFSDTTIKITLFGYTSISNDGTYLCRDRLRTSSTAFNDDFKVTIGATIGFDGNGTVSVIGKFHWNKILGTLTQAWSKINDVDVTKYDSLSAKVAENPDAMEFMEGNSSIFKYTCIIASDSAMRHIIHTDINYSNTIDDFAVPMHGLFNSWKEVPNEVYTKILFTDRLIGQTIVSPTCRFTRENLKYAINEMIAPRSTSLVSKQKLAAFSHMPLQFDKITDMNTDNFNFIDKINCIIQSPLVSEQSNFAKDRNSTASSPRIIYKPIFFKTKDAQPVTIRARVSQNIGINLSEYMTKVDTFIMRLDSSIDCEEIGRTNVYVLFKIDANKIENNAGNYDILTEDGDYVTSGTYTII